MNEIVCATRGGEASRAVQMAAIEQAKESGNPLVFLYVVPTERFAGVEPALQEAVRAEMTWLGRAVLNVAEARAKEEGVTAKKVIRYGNVRDEMCRYLTDHNASLLLVGAPRSTTLSIFGDDPVERFASSIYESTGVDVAVVRPDREDRNTYYAYLVPA